MPKYIEGNIFDAETQTIVNTINCDGFMGKGLAYEFKIRYPKMYEEYKEKCKNKEVEIGHPYLNKDYKRWILNFPTKKHWKYPSKKIYIENGLKYFRDNYKQWDIKSIAFPRLGCNLGELNWKDIKKIMEKYLEDLSFDVVIYTGGENKKPKDEEMLLNFINKAKSDELMQKLKISQKYAKILKKYVEDKGVFVRLKEIKRVPRLGEKTFLKIAESLTIENFENNKHIIRFSQNELKI